MVNLSDLTNMMGQFRNIQENMQQMQEELRQKRSEASSGGGMVTAIVNGKGELVDLKIDAASVDVNDLEMLEDLIKAAVNAASVKSQEHMKEAMRQLTGGMNIPGLEHLGKLLG